MTEAEKLRNALVWHDYAARHTLGAVAALLEATDFDVNPVERHAARNVVKRHLQMAYKALEQAQLVQTIEEDA